MLRNTRWNACWYWDQSTELSTWQCHKDSQTSIGSWDPICYHLPPDNKMKTAKHLSEAKIQSAVTLHLTMKWRQQNTCQKPRSSLLSPSTWQWNEDSKTPVRSRDPVCCHPPPDNEMKTAKHLSELRSSLLSTSIWQWNEDSETPVRAEIQPAVNLHLTMKWRQRNTCPKPRYSLLSPSIWQWNEDSETLIRSWDPICRHPPPASNRKTGKYLLRGRSQLQSAAELHTLPLQQVLTTPGQHRLHNCTACGRNGLMQRRSLCGSSGGQRMQGQGLRMNHWGSGRWIYRHLLLMLLAVCDCGVKNCSGNPVNIK